MFKISTLDPIGIALMGFGILLLTAMAFLIL